jgi:hypothetical protein
LLDAVKIALLSSRKSSSQLAMYSACRSSNAGSIISFRVGVEDAPYLVREFHERFGEIDLLQLPNYRIYLKLMIDGAPSKPFSASTLAPATEVDKGIRPSTDRSPGGEPAALRYAHTLAIRPRSMTSGGARRRG